MSAPPEEPLPPTPLQGGVPFASGLSRSQSLWKLSTPGVHEARAMSESGAGHAYGHVHALPPPPPPMLKELAHLAKQPPPPPAPLPFAPSA